jgi:hypothetical protein
MPAVSAKSGIQVKLFRRYGKNFSIENNFIEVLKLCVFIQFEESSKIELLLFLKEPFIDF